MHYLESGPPSAFVPLLKSFGGANGSRLLYGPVVPGASTGVAEEDASSTEA